MTFDHMILLTLLALPFVGAIVVASLGPKRALLVRYVSLGVTLSTLVLAVVLTGHFLSLDRAPSEDTFHPEFVPGPHPDDPHATTWDMITVGDSAIQFYLGVDGLNIWLILLTAVLMTPCVLISWNSVDERVNEFHAWLLALQTAMFGIFLSFDIILFYVFFELSLVPLFFLIGIWGGAERRYAARKFFIFTLAGSLLTLLGVLGVVLACYQQRGLLTFSIPDLVEQVRICLSIQDATVQAHWRNVGFWVFLAMSAGFAVKVPLAPFHTWLPLAHTEAPTAGSVILAGVLLKVGAYGFLRLCIPLAPAASVAVGAPLITALAAIGIVYGAFCAFAQTDVKKMIAYSSVSHLGVCMLGMFALNIEGITGSLLQMVNHGLSTGLLFLMIGMIYERYHTRKIADYGGMSSRLPWWGALFVFTCLTSVGLPGLNGFVGEVFVLFGIFDRETMLGRFPILAILGCSGIILGAWYLFTLTRNMLFGAVKEPHHEGHAVADVTGRELAILLPLAALCVVLGVFPQMVIDSTRSDVESVAKLLDDARSRPVLARAETPAPQVAARGE